MSLNAMMWAVRDAPVIDPAEHSVLIVMADESDESGCGVLISVSTIAGRSHFSHRGVRRVIADFQDAGIISEGDQSKSVHIRADRRPPVYDLLIPATWFSDLPQVNVNRAAMGLPPITPETRPDILPRSSRAKRADSGRARTLGTEEQQVERGSVVYYLQHSDGLVKIGMSTNLASRVSGLRRTLGGLRLLATEPGWCGRERERHEQFELLRVRGLPTRRGTEWFRPGADLLSLIDSLAAVR